MADLTRAYEEHFATSHALAEQAQAVLPGGLTHDSRRMSPFPVYVSRAQGAHKWTEEGHRLIDYGMGHGALLLGHGHPDVRRAMEDQLGRGTHFAAPHRMEVEWAERVCRLVPSAELVRFTGTGTEATLLAMRLARAFTGRPRILKLQGHFHGWHDEAMVGSRAPFDRPASAGVNPGTATQATAIPANDVSALEVALASGEYAGLILEPSGASWATVPLAPGFLQAARDATSATGTLLIFDEVITGFRLAPGGAQEVTGVVPDLTCLAKVLAGGLPGGAVAGRREILSLLTFAGGPGERVAQQGTFNANPLSAAAGIAALDVVAGGEPQRQASALAARLCDGLNQALQALDVPGCAWRLGSMFHVHAGTGCPIWLEDGELRGDLDAQTLLAGMPHLFQLRDALLLRGTDLFKDGGFVSAAHSEADIDETVAAFEDAVRELDGLRH
jgi:glutamate-1-semialdehyde 2,1-aminomutase